jgi:hypothetical protein
MKLELNYEQGAALLRELDRIIEDDKFPFSRRVRVLKEIRAELKPYPEREPAPPPKQYAPPRAMARRRR